MVLNDSLIYIQTYLHDSLKNTVVLLQNYASTMSKTHEVLQKASALFSK